MFRYVLPFTGSTFIQAFTNYHAISFCIVSNQKNFLSDYSHGFVIIATTVYCRLHMYYVLLLNTFLLIRFATNISGFIALAMCIGEDEGTLTVRRRSTPWMFCAKTHHLWGYNGAQQRDSSMNEAFIWCWLCYRLQEIMCCDSLLYWAVVTLITRTWDLKAILLEDGGDEGARVCNKED